MAELMDLEDENPGGPAIFSQYEYEDMQSVFNPEPVGEVKLKKEVIPPTEEGAKPEGAPPPVEE